MKYNKSDYKEYPKTLEPDDFWGQVRRTMYGKPISEEQILMIVDAIKKCLEFEKSDILLDIACGNGALSRYLFSSCSGFLGIDYSEYLIEVAKKNFEKLPDYQFQVREAMDYVASESNPEIYTKALCYGSFTYLPSDSAFTFLKLLAQRFKKIKKMYIGNLPDKDLAHKFYRDDVDYSDELSNPMSQIGIWRSRKEFECLAHESGWRVVSFHQMPKDFFSAHYRYDVILERRC